MSRTAATPRCVLQACFGFLSRRLDSYLCRLRFVFMSAMLYLRRQILKIMLLGLHLLYFVHVGSRSLLIKM
ncbi:hypothetical protein LOK49_Contig75G00014 [Camellia lanceoleosa]|nr:hypothetical protein LOK49_Contig75G00014 [Camellia lanceoleosa]